LLRSRGHHPARALADRLEATLRAHAIAEHTPGEEEDEEFETGDTH
jgi:hypothetical protein